MLDAVGDRPAGLIPGVGPKTAERLRAAGVGTVRELARRATPPSSPGRWGRGSGAELQARANGVDDRTVETEREPKSESAETTFAEDVSDRGPAARDARPARRARVRGARPQRLPRPHRDGQGAAAAVSHLHPLADARGSDPRRRRSSRRSRASCSAGWSWTRRCAWSASVCPGSSGRSHARRTAACSRRREGG